VILHVLYSPRAEGCPRLALDLIRQQWRQSGWEAVVSFLVAQPDHLLDEFCACSRALHVLGWQRKGFLKLFLRAWRLLRKERPMGVVCYSLGHHVPIAVAAWTLRIPVIVHVGNAPPLDRGPRLKMWLVMRAGAPFVTMHVACSSVVADACRLVYRLSKVLSVPNGIRLEHFAALRATRKRSSERNLTFGMVASLSSHKDQTILIEALHELCCRGVPARLLLAGDGEQRLALTEYAARLDVGDFVDWLGNVADVRSVLERLDVFAFATTSSEGLGIAMVEALAAGVPVVASDVPACREVLESGRWGRLVAVRDARAWADALLSAEATGVPSIDDLARYDVRETWKQYRQAFEIP
jgi:glycosyltransferase involved in cell wall biosynthesis